MITRTSETSTNKEVWIASILSNWRAMKLNFRIFHTKETWGKRKNECQELQSFLHTLILALWRWRLSSSLFSTLYLTFLSLIIIITIAAHCQHRHVQTHLLHFELCWPRCRRLLQPHRFHNFGFIDEIDAHIASYVDESSNLAASAVWNDEVSESDSGKVGNMYTEISSITRGFEISLLNEFMPASWDVQFFDVDSDGQKHGKAVVMILSGDREWKKQWLRFRSQRKTKLYRRERRSGLLRNLPISGTRPTLID